MNEKRNIWAIENGWLVFDHQRVRLDRVEVYARSGNTVAFSCGANCVQLDLERAYQKRAWGMADVYEGRAVVELMTALDRYFWAPAPAS